MSATVDPINNELPAAPRWWQARRGLLVALLGSLAVHAILSLVPDELPAPPERTVLAATLRELPPPPAVIAPPAATPKPKPARTKPKPRPAAVPAAPVPAPTDAPALAQAQPEPSADVPVPAAAADALAPSPEAVPSPVLAEDLAPAQAPVAPKTLPPRVDLAYRVFYGTQGFQIGKATYRFEHAQNRYTIATMGEATGLAAMLFRGRGRMESKGLITANGLQPYSFVVDKFNRSGAERADFDWETGIATLHDNQTAALETPTFDLLALMWQFYFQPPQEASQTFHVATTRRVNRVTLTREREETIAWAHGEIDTEVWHRTSQDGRTEAHVWLAPSLRWIPVKMRVVNTRRGTVEALLDAIRVDETGEPGMDEASAAPRTGTARNEAPAATVHPAESPYTALSTQ